MKTNLDNLFKTDDKAAKEGVDFVINDKTSFRVRHINAANTKMKAAMAKYHKPFARQIELGTLDAAKHEEINIKIFCEMGLVSWTGVEIDGKEVEYTVENALILFKRLPNLFDVLWDHARNQANYKEQETEELGNS